jgi:hypothetical protein
MFDMTEWLKWSLSLALASVFLPLAAGEIAIWTRLFRKDDDDIPRSKMVPPPENWDESLETQSPEPDFRPDRD